MNTQQRSELPSDKSLGDLFLHQSIMFWVFICISISTTLAVNTGCCEDATILPNIVLIFIDDLGYADIGPFGNQQVRTPNLDRMAAEGMKFNSFYATPVCSMSRACLMTGCYNTRVSIPGVLFPRSEIGLHTNEITLAEIVKQKGYATKCIGKWHLGHREPFLPTKQGFDSYYGIPYSNDMTIDPQHARFAKDCIFREDMTEEKARLMGIRNTVPLMRDLEVIEYPVDQSTLTKRYTEQALKFIRENQAQPFFLYLPHAMIHFPLAASADFKGKSESGLLGDAIEEIDWSVGQILSTLQELKIDQNTLVIFTSDNGPAGRPAPPFRGNKATIFEGGVREPCIMRWPGKVPANTTCQQIAGNIDLLPTFAKLVGVETPQDRVIDGRDITSLMFSADAKPVRDTHLYFNPMGRLGAIRQGNWKLFIGVEDAAESRERKGPPGKSPLGKGRENQFAKSALFDLEKDPGENHDLVAEHPEIVAKLEEEAKARWAEIEKNRRPAGTFANE